MFLVWLNEVIWGALRNYVFGVVECKKTWEAVYINVLCMVECGVEVHSYALCVVECQM